MNKRHTKILIETEEVVVVRNAAKPIVSWCPKCRRQTQKVTTVQAALLYRVDQNRIEEWIQSGHLHVSQTPAGSPLICLTSLSD